jgi:alpha-beta hydrolase superfamily lysophospholipase
MGKQRIKRITVAQGPGCRIWNSAKLAALKRLGSPASRRVYELRIAFGQPMGIPTGLVLYRLLGYTIPNSWDKVKTVAEIHVPVLVMHSGSDRVNPVDGEQMIFAAAQKPKTLTILHC